MDLFSLVAKLTLDASDFTSKIAEVKGEAQTISIDDPHLGLDTSEFDRGIDSANSAEVDDPDAPTLGLDDETFTQGIEDANSAEVEDPAEPTLDIDDSGFTEGIEDANEAEVDDPDTPSLDLDTDGFTQGIKDAQDSGTSFGEIMGQVFENLKGALVTSGIVGSVAAVVNYLKQGVSLASQHGDTIDKQSQSMRLSAKAYQEWDYALQLAGTDISALQRGMKNWQQTIGSGEDSEEKLAESFRKLGINADEAFEKIANGGNMDDLLSQTISALADYTGEDKGAIQEALFGKNSTGLNALLNQTSSEIEAIKEEANDLGLIMTDDEVKNAAEYTDAITRLESASNGLKEALASSIIPLLTSAANWLADIVGSLNWRTANKTGLEETLENIDQDATKAVINSKAAAEEAKSLVEQLESLGDYWTLDEAGKTTWNALAEKAIELFPQLSGIIDTDTKSIQGNTDEINKNIEAWTALEEQRILSQAVEDKRTAIAQTRANALDKEIEADLKLADAQGEKVKAYAALDEYLKNHNVDYQNLVAQYGYTGEMTDEVYEAASGYWTSIKERSDARTVKTALGEYEGALSEVKQLRGEAETMYADADQAEQDLEEYYAKLKEKMGLADDGVDETTNSVNNASTSVQTLIDKLNSMPSSKSVDIVINYLTNGAHAMSHAIGSEYIPYDNYPAILHRGEKVLTATEARQESSSGSDYSGMEESIVAAIKSGMEGATVTSYLNGKDITDVVNRNNTNDLKSRRYRS